MKNVTLLDIAADVGVSRATVSLVMRGSSLVADETRERVLASARRLGYVYHRGAASLRSQRTGTIGMIVSTLRNPFFAELVTGVEAAIGPSGLSILMTQHSEDCRSQERMFNRLLESRVDGLIVTAAPATESALIDKAVDSGIPVIMAVRNINGAHAAYVGADVVLGARQAFEHMLIHAPDVVGLIGGYASSSTFEERIRGARLALGDLGVQFRAIPGPPTREAGYLLTKELLSTSPGRAAILAYNDIVAFGAAQAIRELNFKTGTDVVLVGFDDIEAARYDQPAPTTVRVNPAGIGRTVAHRLLQLMDGQAVARSTLTSTSLVVRQSCGC